MQTSSVEKPTSKWYQDWQAEAHAVLFDSRSRLSNGALVRHYESFSDVQLLRGTLAGHQKACLLEVGCATGEFYRYLRVRYPRVRYYGVDISRAAIERARQKYPRGTFFLSQPDSPLRSSMERLGLTEEPEVIYSKDVLHHQTDPFGFLSELLMSAREALVLRLRTRDRGPTVTDPELSCQYHYQGWMPYLVLDVQEVVDFIRERVPDSELVVRRSYCILGGHENRYLPKECYLPETGTAETAIAVFRRSGRPGQVQFEDRQEEPMQRGLRQRMEEGLKRLMLGRAS